MRKEYKHHKTISDAFAEYNKTKSRKKLNVIPGGSSIITPQPPKLKIYTTICDNGARRIRHYYLGGRHVNALGFGLTKRNLQFINKNKCKGCYNNRCVLYKYFKGTTAQTKRKKSCLNNFK